MICLILIPNICSHVSGIDGQCIRQGWPCVAGLIQIMLGPTTKKIRRSDGKWLVIEITIANIVRRARFDKFDLARTAIARTRDPASVRLGSARHGAARCGSPPKSRRIVISRIERARNIGADRSNKRRIGLFLSLLMAMARPGFISQSPALKSIPFSSFSSSSSSPPPLHAPTIPTLVRYLYALVPHCSPIANTKKKSIS